jgi:hypothetical protein
MPTSPDGIRLYWGPGFSGLFLLQECQCCRLPVLLCVYNWLPKERSLVLPQASFSPLVRPCPWLKLQQQVHWLPPGPLPVPRSFQPPAEVFLFRISLGENPSSF